MDYSPAPILPPLKLIKYLFICSPGRYAFLRYLLFRFLDYISVLTEALKKACRSKAAYTQAYRFALCLITIEVIV